MSYINKRVLYHFDSIFIIHMSVLPTHFLTKNLILKKKIIPKKYNIQPYTVNVTGEILVNTVEHRPADGSS